MFKILAFLQSTPRSSITPSPNETGNPIQRIEQQFHLHLPPWLFATLSIIALASIIIGLLSPIFTPAKAIITLIGKIFIHRHPKDAKRARRRAQFADHIESQLRRLSEKEEWRDDRFTELEAEVEIEGHQRRLGPTFLIPARNEALRRVKSLSLALERSTERLIILQGEPGSGKSVALRHVGQRLAQSALRKPSEKSVIPLYLNLKELRPSKHPIDDNEIREFVFRSLNRANNRDVERFLNDEFDRGMSEGTWLFLLDSFDEIPDILGAIEVDSVVEEYADALYDFLHGWNRSRGIVASREFRGPRRFGWPKFTVVRLSARQKADLISRADLPRRDEEELIAGLTDADVTISQLSDNPLFLGLLCEHIRGGKPFPQSTHVVFESYITNRLQRDAELVYKRFRIRPEEIRAIAEEVAFSMAAKQSVGLNPTRLEIYEALGASVENTSRIDRALDALEYIKLARSDEETNQGGPRSFTFAHRRFQEYFSTCVVLREPGRVSLDSLLTDGRWRETAVTILQTQTGDIVHAMFNLAQELLDNMTSSSLFNGADATDSGGRDFGWPSGSLHLLSLLNAGMGKNPEHAPAALRSVAGRLISAAWELGRRHDRKWTVDVVPIANTELTTRILEESFTSESALLRQTAYLQAGRLRELPENLKFNMRKGLIGLSCGGRLRKQRIAVRAQLKRLTNPVEFLRGVTLLVTAPAIDFILLFAASLFALNNRFPSMIDTLLAALGYALAIHTTFYLLRAANFFASAPSLTPMGRAVVRLTGAASSDSFGPPDPLKEASSLSVAIRMLLLVPLIWASSPAHFSFAFTHLLNSHFSFTDVTLKLVLGLIVILYCATWSASALYIFVSGRSSALWRWPFFPFIFLVHWLGVGLILLTHGAKAALKVRVRFNFNWRVAIASSAITCGFLAAVAFFIYALVHWHIVQYVFEAFIVLSIIAGVTGSGIRVMSSMINRRKDSRMLRNQLSGQQRFNKEDFLRILPDIRSDEGLRALVHALRRGEYPCSRDVIDILSDIGAYVELVHKSLESRFSSSTDMPSDIDPANVPTQIKPWLQRSEDTSHSLSPVDVSNETLDEIARLVEAQSNAAK